MSSRPAPPRRSARPPAGGPAPTLVLWCLALGVLAAAAAPIAAQEERVPSAEPGSVVTVPLTVEPPDGPPDEDARYRVEAHPEVRLFGAAEGTAAPEEGRIVLPLTFQLGSSVASGRLEAVTVTFLWTDGTSRRATAEVFVPSRHRLEGRLTSDVGTVAPGGEATLLFRLINRGNASDTVRIREVREDDRWTVRPSRSHVALEPGEERDVPVLVRAPREADVGESRRLRLLAEGRGETVRAEVLFRVVDREGWLPGLEHLPTELFVGSSAGGAGAGEVVASLHAEGTVGADTEVSLRGRYQPASGGARPFRRDVAGPPLQLEVRRPDGSLAVGDVYARASPLAGDFQSGRGVDLAYRGERFTGEVFAATSSLGSDPEGGGRSLLASGRMELDAGRAGFTVSDQRWRRLEGGSAWTRSGGGHVELEPSPVQYLRLEAGLMSVGSDEGESVTGPAGEAEYSLYGSGTSLDVRARRVPGAVGGGSGRSNELVARGRQRLLGDVHALARGHWSETPLLENGPNPEIRRIGTGLRYDPGSLRMEGLLRYRESRGVLPGEGWRTRRSAALTADLPLGPLRVSGDLELGTETAGVTRAEGFRRLTTTARWSDASSWVWMTAGEERVPGLPPRRHAEIQGGTHVRELQMSGGLAVEDAVRRARLRLWSRLGYEVAPGLSLVVEAERRPTSVASSEWTVSFGVRRALDLPLPIPSTPVARGVVYDDRDGDRERDPGEPGIPGVRVRKGFVEAVTDENGRFEIDQEAVRGRPLEVVGASLPTGVLVPGAARYPDDGEMAIPAVRTAALHLAVFLDRDDDGVRDEGEPAAATARVELEDGSGRRRVAETDDGGRARFGGLRPGAYSVEVRLPATTTRLQVSTTREVRLEAGESAAISLPLPVRDRPVRF